MNFRLIFERLILYINIYIYYKYLFLQPNSNLKHNQRDFLKYRKGLLNVNILDPRMIYFPEGNYAQKGDTFILLLMTMNKYLNLNKVFNFFVKQVKQL